MLLYIHKIKKGNDKKYAWCILLGNELSLNDYSYLREHYMFEILGYIFGEIIESIYPVEGPLDIFKADKSRIMSAYDTIS